MVKASSLYLVASSIKNAHSHKIMFDPERSFYKPISCMKYRTELEGYLKKTPETTTNLFFLKFYHNAVVIDLVVSDIFNSLFYIRYKT